MNIPACLYLAGGRQEDVEQRVLHREVDGVVNLLELPTERGRQLQDQHLQHDLLPVPPPFRRVASVPLLVRVGRGSVGFSLIDDEYIFADVGDTVRLSLKTSP